MTSGSLPPPPRVALAGLALGVLFSVIVRGASAGPFPDAHDPPTTGWAEPVFKLSQDFPATLPAAGTMPWKSFSFRTQPEQYIKAVLALFDRSRSRKAQSAFRIDYSIASKLVPAETGFRDIRRRAIQHLGYVLPP